MQKIVTLGKEILVDGKTLDELTVVNKDSSVKKRGVFFIQQNATSDLHLVRILPSSMIDFKHGDGKGEHIVLNPEKADDFLICPRCLVHWHKKAVAPRKCPFCQQALTEYPLNKLALTQYLTNADGMVRVLDPEDPVWKFHFRTRESRMEQVQQMMDSMDEEPGTIHRW